MMAASTAVLWVCELAGWKVEGTADPMVGNWAVERVVRWAASSAALMAGSRAELSVDLMAASTAGQRVSSRADSSAALMAGSRADLMAASTAVLWVCGLAG